MTETITKKMMLLFPQCECEKPIIYHLVKDYDLVVNIFRAKVTPKEEGYLVLDVTGTEDNIEKALEFIKTFDVKISYTNKGMMWDKSRCTHCGQCIPFCPTGALYFIDDKTREVIFDEQKCIECMACIQVCSFGACSSAF